jgi:Tfp pilus assembly protein PilF
VALPNLPSRREAYEHLALAYENLGFPEKARELQRQAAMEKPD